MVPDGQKYLDYAEKILKSLSSDAYLAKVGDNQGFILMHSVGSLPNGSEIDTPLNYADYYYLEALKRFMELKKLRVENGELRVTNRNHHIDLSLYRCLWTLSVDGKEKERGEITLPEIAPGESGTIGFAGFPIIETSFRLPTESKHCFEIGCSLGKGGT